jgi:hypothetical protein
MTEPTTPTVQHDDDGQTIISGITLILNGARHARQQSAGRHQLGADALTTLANGETAAALGAALSSLLDMLAAGQPKIAVEALAISQELARRIVVTRAELRASL